uniref:Ulp1 protease family, C-terminal catalytic domain-containing protein n=1 Tax=Tanacetum cinerariifolium TaxID=118510 RepID=A0A6L2LJJ1_TANCI|nr:ulp1 protease family, C-terminal catalytic domain-containing protein [Tanacetum cinerariifolium]
MDEEENNLIETPIQKKVYQIRIKSNSKKKKIDSFVCNDYDDSIDEVDPNITLKEVVRDINKSSAEYIDDNSNDEDNKGNSSNDEDNEDSHSAKKEQNTEDYDSVKTPPVKKRGRIKKIVRANENKSSSIKRGRRPRKSNDESKKQTIGSKRKGREYKVEDDDDNDGTKRMKKKIDHKEAKVKRKTNQKNTKRKIVDESSSRFEVTTTSSKAKKHKKNIKISDKNKKNIKIRTRTTPTTLFNAMSILNVDRKKCLYKMGFGSMIGMAIHELPGMLGFYVIDNLDTETNVLSLTDNSILVTSQSMHDILGIPMGGCLLESLASRSPDDPFIKEWFSQFGEKNEVWPNDITDVIVSTKDADKLFKINFLMLFANTMGLCETSGVCNVNILKKIRDDGWVEKIDEKLDEGLSRFPDCKKLNKSHEKFEENTTGIDNDDTTGIDKESDSPDCQMESNSPAFDDDNQKNVGCSILDLDDAKLDVYNGSDLRSPYEYLPVHVRKPVLDIEKIVADTLFEMIGSKLDLIFESQSGIGLSHLEMETLTSTLMVSAYRKVFVQYLYYVKHPKAEAIEKAKIKRMKMSWRTTRNSTDCGVFTMLHMESYIGAEEEWKCGLAKESKNKMNN